MNPSALENLLVTLSTNRIRFILVGGLAVELCGHQRATYDVDILLDTETNNLTHFLETLSQLGEGYAKELTVDDFDLTEGCITIHDFDLQLDVFSIMGGKTYEQLLPYTLTHFVNSDASILHLNADGLILLKSDSVRPKDQQDVAALKSIHRPQN